MSSPSLGLHITFLAARHTGDSRESPVCTSRQGVDTHLAAGSLTRRCAGLSSPCPFSLPPHVVLPRAEGACRLAARRRDFGHVYKPEVFAKHCSFVIAILYVSPAGYTSRLQRATDSRRGGGGGVRDRVRRARSVSALASSDVRSESRDSAWALGPPRSVTVLAL